MLKIGRLQNRGRKGFHLRRRQRRMGCPQRERHCTGRATANLAPSSGSLKAVRMALLATIAMHVLRTRSSAGKKQNMTSSKKPSGWPKKKVVKVHEFGVEFAFRSDASCYRATKWLTPQPYELADGFGSCRSTLFAQSAQPMNFMAVSQGLTKEACGNVHVTISQVYCSGA